MKLKNAVNALAIIGEWSAIAVLIFLNARLISIPLALVSVFIIGSRFHALGILMHEAAHFNLFSSAKWNDFAAQVFLCSPFLISLSSYRTSHILHHQFSLTERDPTFTRKRGEPAFVFPKKSSRFFIWELAKIFFGYGIILNLKDVARNSQGQSKSKLKSILIPIALIFTLAVLNYAGVLIWFFVLWLLPIFTVLPLLNYWRTICEHSAVSTPEPTRTVVYGMFSKWFLAPYNVNYHLEHHLFPKKPWYTLPAVHGQRPLGIEDGHVTNGLFNLWKEFVL